MDNIWSEILPSTIAFLSFRAEKKDSMLQELHETEDSFKKEDSVLEQCELLSVRLREALQAHEQDRYDVPKPHASVLYHPSCLCICTQVVDQSSVITPFTV